MRHLVWGLAPFLAVLAACGITPRPRILSQADAVAEGRAAQAAERLAPQAFLHAEQLREKAHAAFADDDLPVAQILSEHAIAAYDHAFVLARLAKAEERRQHAQEDLERAEQALHQLDKQQQLVAAEADDLEMRIRVVRDAEPLPRNAPTSAKREQARWEVARSLALQGRLLCTSARLLDDQSPELQEHHAALDVLDKALAARPEVVPVDDAIRLRSACLERLTITRRGPTQDAPAAGASDALLAELGDAGGLFVFRDDRGIVVTLRSLFAQGAQLTPAAEGQLAMLGRVAKAHPTFPVLVVVHGEPGAAPTARGDAIVEALRRGGAGRVELHLAGDAQPVVEPGRRGARERNSRIEIVFVAPTS